MMDSWDEDLRPNYKVHKLEIYKEQFKISAISEDFCPSVQVALKFLASFWRKKLVPRAQKSNFLNNEKKIPPWTQPRGKYA